MDTLSNRWPIKFLKKDIVTNEYGSFVHGSQDGQNYINLEKA